MAINGCEIKIIKYLIDQVQARLNRRPRVLTLGYPDILAVEETFSRLELPVEWKAIPKRSDSEAVWKTHGRDCGNYPMCESKALINALGGDCIVVDAISWGQEDEIVDLNQPLTSQQKEKLGNFDIIIDPGTIKHCFNIAQAFINIVELLAPSGFVYHQAAVAFPNHGFFSISPTTFFDFYESRHFILGVPYIWLGAKDKDGCEPRFLQIDPFEMLNNFPPFRMGCFIFQKGNEATAQVDGPYYPIQRCYSGKSRYIPTINFTGRAMDRQRKEVFTPHLETYCQALLNEDRPMSFDVQTGFEFIKMLAGYLSPEQTAAMFSKTKELLAADPEGKLFRQYLFGVQSMFKFTGLEPAFFTSCLARFVQVLSSVPAGRRKVLFVADMPYFMILREALYLKKNNFSPFLVLVNPATERLWRSFQSAFDGIINVGGYPRLRAVLRAVKVDAIHVQCFMWKNLISRVAIEECQDVPVVCEFYDVTSIYADRDVLCSNWDADQVDLDIALEAYTLRYASGIITRFNDLAVVEWMDQHGAHKPFIRMLPYPVSEFTDYRDEGPPRKDGPLRLVYAGGLAPQNDRHPAALFSQRHQHKTFRSLLEQGFSLDIFHDPNRLLSTEDGLAVFRELAMEFKHCRFIDGVPPDQLSTALKDYDYALILTHIDRDVLKVRDALLKYGVGAKLFSYFEAGLPVIVNAEYEEMSSLVVNNGLGLSIHTNDIGKTAELVKGFNQEEARRNIRRYNDQHGMHREILRLIAFYEKLGVSKPFYGAGRHQGAS